MATPTAVARLRQFVLVRGPRLLDRLGWRLCFARATLGVAASLYVCPLDLPDPWLRLAAPWVTIAAGVC